MGVIMDAKSLQKLVRPLPAGVVLHVLKYSCFFFFFCASHTEILVLAQRCKK